MNNEEGTESGYERNFAVPSEKADATKEFAEIINFVLALHNNSFCPSLFFFLFFLYIYIYIVYNHDTKDLISCHLLPPLKKSGATCEVAGWVTYFKHVCCDRSLSEGPQLEEHSCIWAFV